MSGGEPGTGTTRGMSTVEPRDGERGFTLIEALVATGILTSVLLCVLGAVAGTVRAANSAAPRAALAEIAQNVLADLRAATAYDPDELAALAATGTRHLTLDETQADGSSAQRDVTAAVAPNAAGAGYDATVTVGDAAGNTVTMHTTLVQEAPVPGSVLPLSTPMPSGASTEQRAACLLGRGCRAVL